MTDRIITQKIKAEVLNNGMDVVGFAPVERWKTAPFLLSPQAILPGAKTVVVTGIHITDTWTEMGGEPDPQSLGPGGWMDQNSFLDRIAYRVVRLLNDHGYKAIAIASSNIWRYREFEGIDSIFAPDLSHIHAAAAAGLAQIGWSGLAITPEYGPRVRFTSIVTDAELEATPMYDGPELCDLCMECVKACPSAALRKDFNGKPHEVIIEGKKFRYANKNMWRCAWAEHFMLPLTSKTLEKDHIDETDILNELASTTFNAHERGVCQKVCIPPHLRTDKDSFGRPDKKISMNRVNRKYNDNMPTLKKMRDDIIAKAVNMGVDIVGVVPLQVDSKAGKAILKQAPGMKTVLAFAYQIPKESKERFAYNSYIYNSYQYALQSKTHQILLVIARYIEEQGYYAASYTGSIPEVGINLKEVIDKNEYGHDPHGSKVNLLAYELAQMAGIGRIEDMFRTTEFGEDVCIGAVVTDAPLDEIKQDVNVIAKTPKVSLKPTALKSILEEKARQNLVSLFGVAQADIFDSIVEDLKKNINEEELGKGIIDEDSRMHGKWRSKIIHEDVKIRRPKDYLPEAKSVIVLGMHFPGELIENSGLNETKQIGTYAYHNYQTIFELRYAAMELAIYLNKLGYKTIVTENMLGVGSKVDTPRHLLPDFRCGAIEAVTAGLGQLGRNGGLLTREFGAHQRQIVIITDAELPADKMDYGERICTDCGNCETKCPMNAYEKTFFSIQVGDSTIQYPHIERHRCDWAKRYSLHKDEGPALIGNKTHVEVPHEGEVTIEELAEACTMKDEVMKKRTVILEPCLRYCTAGSK